MAWASIRRRVDAVRRLLYVPKGHRFTDDGGWRRALRHEPDLFRSYLCAWSVCRRRIGRSLRSTSGCTLRSRHFNPMHHSDDLVCPTCARFRIDPPAWKRVGTGPRLAIATEADRGMVQAGRTRHRAWLVEHKLHPWGVACYLAYGVASRSHWNRGANGHSSGIHCIICSLDARSPLLLQGDVSPTRLLTPRQRFPQRYRGPKRNRTLGADSSQSQHTHHLSGIFLP